MEMVGRTLGNYRIISLLGTGRLGRVYHATDQLRERPAALKIFHEQFTANPDLRTQFLQRTARLSLLRHAHLVEHYDAGEFDGFLYLATELCADGSLGRLVREAAGSGTLLPLATSLDLIEQAAEGLEYAHSHEIIHGEITPDNLLLVVDSGSRVLKIGDFGQRLFANDVPSDSLGYRAPEQRCGREPDERSDVYALGVVLYQLVTGRLPLSRDGRRETNGQTLHTGLPSRGALAPERARSLEDVIAHSLAERPDERYASVAKLAIALRTLSLPVPTEDAVVGAVPLPPLTTQHVPRAAVRLVARDHRVALAPGETRQLRVTVENAGSATDEFLVGIEPSAVVQTEDQPRRVRLEAEQQELIALSITLDKDSRIVPGEYRLRILARAALSDAVNDTAFAAAVILPERPGPLTIRQMGAPNGAQCEFQLDLFNEGSVTTHYTLAASDPGHQLQYRFNADIVTVEPGRSRTIVLSVRDRRRQSTGFPRQFLVIATPARGEPISATANFSRPVLKRRGPLPILIGISVTLVLLLLGLLFLLHVAGAPLL